MKLLLCEKCWDVFKMDYALRACKCGAVHGRYITNSLAEVSPNAVSLAIGNGSLQNAVTRVQKLIASGADQSMNREDFYTVGKIEYAWVRPNSGPGNPHTRIEKKAA